MINRIKLSNYHSLLMLSIVLAPFSQLRISFFGLAEIILISAFIYESTRKIKKKQLKQFYFTKFWLIYLLLISISSGYNQVILGREIDSLFGMIFDYSSYIFVLISCFVFEKVFIDSRINTYLMIKNIFFLSSLFLLFLYILSFFTSSIFGLQLMFYDRFSPLVDNIHQIAMVLVILPFVGIKIIKVEQSFFIKLSVFILSLLDIVMAISTGASKAPMGILLGIFVYLLRSTIKNNKFFIILILFTVTGVVGFLIIDNSLLIETYFSDIDGGGARAFLYVEGFHKALESLIIGYGAGPHIWFNNEWSDSHSTLITVLLQGGLIGIVFLFILFAKVIVRLLNQPVFFASLFPILIYLLGGDLMRKYYIWLFIIIFFYYRKRDEEVYLSRTNKKEELL